MRATRASWKQRASLKHRLARLLAKTGTSLASWDPIPLWERADEVVDRTAPMVIAASLLYVALHVAAALFRRTGGG